MRPLCDLRAVCLFGQRRRCSSFPDKIPAAETRRRRHQIGLAATTGQSLRRPSGGRVDPLALDDRTFGVVLAVGKNATLSPSMKWTSWTS
jgi:hypothetical protein